MSFTITQSAATRINHLVIDEKENSFFRISITGGGCSGFQYNFIFDDVITPDDQVFEHYNTKIVIDDISLGLIAGGELTFTEDLVASRFVITNPNATAGCGCGNSFTL
ncbi:MAG: iron-sulfur cluster insertion protein ErpA [Alphaproteobacteria bacterium]|nr:iron-sulfur cluster insertion protein ErpA [Alphaproteobacteria bacterium]MDP5012192.1 iron-sulfur cluster insertion protein ErpA [Alphaproteobacteria bacterium]